MRAAFARFGVDRRGWTSSAVFAVYALLAFLYLGLRLLIDPGGQYLGYLSDPKAFIWCFAWWPYAIVHGQNPFVTHALWAPNGVNLIWTTSVPGLALVFAPVTLVFGPVVSYNLATVLLPAFAAFTAFLLCRHLTRALWPSLVGGYLFGFSAYVFGQEEGHPHMTAVFLVPLVALVAVRYLEGELDGRGLALRLGPLFGFEFLISTEVTFTLGLAIVLALLLALAFLPRRRRRLLGLVAPLVGGYAFAGLLTAPFVYYALTGFRKQAFHPPTGFATDLLNFVVPTKLSAASVGWADSISSAFPGNGSEQDAYLGLPALVIIALYLWRRARAPSGRFLIGTLFLAGLGSLGASLTVHGSGRFTLPWAWVDNWPLFDNVLPERLAMYVALIGAVVVALWTAARPPGRVRFLLPALAVVAIIPNPAAGVWSSHYTMPAFFTDSAYRTCLDPNENILPFPISSGDESMLWQALSNFRFRMAGGNIAPQPPPSFLSPSAIALVTESASLNAGDASALRAFIQQKQVTSVVVDETQQADWVGALDQIASPETLGGVVLYHISDGSPSCLGAA